MSFMRLAVNIDHIATLREARKAREPEPLAAALVAEMAGGPEEAAGDEVEVDGRLHGGVAMAEGGGEDD